MRFFKLIPWLVLFLLVMPLTGFANEAAPPDAIGDIQEIRERGELRIGIMEVMAPPFVFEQDGVLSGYDVDISRDMAASLGVKATFVRIPGGYDDVVKAVAAGRADIGMCELSKTAKRSQFVYFSHIYFTSQIVLAVNRVSLAKATYLNDMFNPNDVESILRFFNKPEFKISTMEGSSDVFLTKKLFPHAQLVPADSWNTSIMKVYEGQVDVAVVASSAFNIATHHNPEYLYKLEELGLKIDDPIAVAVNPTKPELLRWVNDYLEAEVLQDPITIKQIIHRYLAFDDEHEHDAEDVAVSEVVDEQEPAKKGNILLVAGAHALLLGALWWWVIRKKGESHWLLSPWSVLAAMALGGLTGVNYPGLSEFFSRPAAIYMGFWKMCVLPIMITAIITSVYRLLSSGGASLVKKLLIYTPLLLLGAAVVGVGFGVVMQPGADFPETAQRMLVVNLGNEMESGQAVGIFEQVMEMAGKIVPDNVIAPLVNNQSLAVLFIAVFFGVAITRSGGHGKVAVVDILEVILDAFTRMVRASLYLLPLALYALAFDFMAKAGVELLLAIVRFVMSMTLGMMPALLFAGVVLKIRLRISMKELFRQFGPIFLLSFSARSSVISMPIGLEALGKCDRIDKNQAVAAFPFALLICHFTYTIFYTMTPIFIAQAFGIDLSLGQYIGIALLGILATAAAIGTIGMAFVLLLSIVCGPIGLPLEPAILVGMAVVSIVDPLLSAVQAIFACGVTTFLVDESSKEEHIGTEAVAEQGS